jgi:hypothetical protein
MEGQKIALGQLRSFAQLFVLSALIVKIRLKADQTALDRSRPLAVLKPGYFKGSIWVNTGRSRKPHHATSAPGSLRLPGASMHHREFSASNITAQDGYQRGLMPDIDVSHWVTLEALAEVIAFLAFDKARAMLRGAAIPVTGRSWSG